MSNNYYQRKRQTNHVDDTFGFVKVYLPKETIRLLKIAARDHRLPVSRICAIAIDNEFDQGEHSFNYPFTIPQTAFTEHEHADEAGKILNFLRRYPDGLAKDVLMMCRRDLGVESREKFLLGFRELLNADLVEIFTKNLTYGESSDRVRFKTEDPAEVKRRKVKNINLLEPDGV